MTRAERSGLPIALAGFALLSVGDAITKSMAPDWSPAAIGALRFLFGVSYVQIVVAMGLGWAVFGEMPDTVAVAGAGVILVAGLLLLAQSGGQPDLAAPLSDRGG